MRTIVQNLPAVGLLMTLGVAEPVWADPKIEVSAETETTAAETVVAVEATATQALVAGIVMEATAAVELIAAPASVDLVEAAVMAGPGDRWALGVAVMAAPGDGTAGVGATARWAAALGAWEVEVEALALAPVAGDGAKLRVGVSVSWGK